MKRMRLLALVLVLPGFASGCVLTKLATVPMRAVATVVSIVPAVGNSAHDAIDNAAAVVDEVPI
ncbi:MAG: DUF6726 family protein [Planctomycetota bacterium]